MCKRSRIALKNAKTSGTIGHCAYARLATISLWKCNFSRFLIESCNAIYYPPTFTDTRNNNTHIYPISILSFMYIYIFFFPIWKGKWNEFSAWSNDLKSNEFKLSGPEKCAKVWLSKKSSHLKGFAAKSKKPRFIWAKMQVNSRRISYISIAVRAHSTLVSVSISVFCSILPCPAQQIDFCAHFQCKSH